MISFKAAFSGISVDDRAKAKAFYTQTLGLKLKSDDMGLTLQLPGGGELFIYQKDDHIPATFTVLNFVVENIDQALEELQTQGIQFERYELGDGMNQDEKGILRGKAANMGPDIAWFKDPAGNILSILQD